VQPPILVPWRPTFVYSKLHDRLTDFRVPFVTATKLEETIVGWPRLLVAVSFSFSCILQIWWLSPFHLPLELAELYRQRWQAEQHLRDLKTTLNMDKLRCKTVDGVLKELHVFVLVYNLARVVLCAAARRQGLPIARLSFIDAVRWLRSAKTGEVLSKLVVNPNRPDRVEPRVVKRRPKEYDRKTQPRAELRKRLLEGPLAA